MAGLPVDRARNGLGEPRITSPSGQWLSELRGPLRCGFQGVMLGHVPPIPPRDDLLALFRAALSNGNDLLDDALVLAEPTASHVPMPWRYWPGRS